MIRRVVFQNQAPLLHSCCFCFPTCQVRVVQFLCRRPCPSSFSSSSSWNLPFRTLSSSTAKILRPFFPAGPQTSSSKGRKFEWNPIDKDGNWNKGPTQQLETIWNWTFWQRHSFSVVFKNSYVCFRIYVYYIYIYMISLHTYLEPKWPLCCLEKAFFWGLDRSNLQQKLRSLELIGTYYIYLEPETTIH